MRLHFLAASLALTLASSAQAAERKCAQVIDSRRLPEAQALTQRGKEAYDAGHYDEAVSLFEDAHCILPAPAFRYNVSSAYLKMNRCGEAVRYARLWTAEADKEDSAGTLDWMATLAKDCAEVTIDSDPSDARLWVDDEEGTGVGATPWSGWLRTGPHKLFLRDRAGLEKRTKIQIRPGTQPPIQVSMTPVVPVQPPPRVVRSAHAAPKPPPDAVEIPKPIPEPQVEAKSPAYWPWIVLGAAAAAGIAGGVTEGLSGGIAGQNHPRIDGGTTYNTISQQQADTANTLATTGLALFIGAGAMAVTGGIGLGVELPKAGSGGGFSLSGRF